jgi:hypothetical protein
MPSEEYWRQAEAQARATAGRVECSYGWHRLADFYREMAETERKRAEESKR